MKASSVLFLLSMAVLVLGKKKNEALNRDSVPFWLQDIRDGEGDDHDVPYGSAIGANRVKCATSVKLNCAETVSQLGFHVNVLKITV